MNVPIQIPLTNIRVGDRLRKIDPDRVTVIAESIEDIGLQTPISVVKNAKSEHYDLVAGLHRLEACRGLHHLVIDAAVLEMTEVDRRLWEIDENLARAELTPAARARFLARRKELYETKFPKTRQGVAGAEAKHRGATANLSFTADTASKTGESERTIQREIRRAKKIAPDILEKIEGTANDKGDILDQLVRLEPAKQQQAVDRLVQGKGLRPPKPNAAQIRAESERNILMQIKRLWKKAPRTARMDFARENESELRRLLGERP